MAKVNVSLPQGTRDFGADVVRKRNYIFNTIKSVFELYGFEPLETPAMENLDTLMGKYGEEGDKLLFKILNNGLDNPAKHQAAKDEFEKILAGKNSSAVTERALKYDLTIPFARYVAMNHHQLTMPFKRYQVQPVWRADRPQKGRYREFYQCDADVVGSHSLLNEVELTSIYATVFQELGLDVEIKINNRKILQGIAEYCGCIDKLVDITTAIDKLDKIGKENVANELISRGIPSDKIQNIFECIFIDQNDEVFYSREELEDTGYTIKQIEDYLRVQNSVYRKDIGVLNCLKGWFSSGEDDDTSESLAPTGVKGIEELIQIFEYLVDASLDIKVKFDVSLARGLNYYTGCIFEVKANNVQMGSIGGGGRYDDLTGLFGVPNIPGVGISFGVDRIYDVMEELQLFPATVHTGTKLLFFNLGDAESKKAFELMQHLRNKGVACELFHETSKFDKQFKYAEKKQIPFIVIIGTKELDSGTCNVKELSSGVQETISFVALLEKF